MIDISDVIMLRLCNIINFTLTSIRTDRVGGLRNCGQLPTIVRFVDCPCQSELLNKKEGEGGLLFPFDIHSTELAHRLI